MWGWGVGTQILERHDWTTLSKQCVNRRTHAKPSNPPLGKPEPASRIGEMILLCMVGQRGACFCQFS